MCVVVARRRKGRAIIARGEKNNIFVSSLSLFYLSIVVIVSSSSKKKKKTTISKVWGKIRTHFFSRENLQNTMSIIRRHHCPHTTKDRCRRVPLGREGGSSSGGHFGGMVVSSQAAPSFRDRVHFRPVLRVGFTKTSLGMCVILLVLYLLCVRVRFRASLTQNFVSFLFLLRSRALSTRPDGLDVPRRVYVVYTFVSLVCTHAIPHVAHTKLCVFSFPKNA